MAKVMFVSVATWVVPWPDPDGAVMYGVVAIDSHGQLWERYWNGTEWQGWERVEAPEEILDVL